MLNQGEGGRIIMTSSTSGLIGNFGQANYGAAKAGVAGFMRVLALEGMKYGITVNVLAPAALSRMTEDLMPESEETVRMAPEKVSPTVAWLCTDAAAKVTGRQFCVSGNRTTLLSFGSTMSWLKKIRCLSLGPLKPSANRSRRAWTIGQSC